jgi:hypothetical protein
MQITEIRISAALILACTLCACAPTFESHLDSPPEYASEPPAPVERPMPITIAPLDPRPQLPDADQTPCPLGSGLTACFTFDQDLARQKRFKMLHDDREYCRDAYDKAVKRAAQVNR